MTKDLGLRLKIARQGRKLSQTELAERVGINQNNIAQYEAGKVLPKLDTIVKFSQELGCGIEWLITGKEGKIKTDEKLGKTYEMMASYSPSVGIDVAVLEQIKSDLEKAYLDQIESLKAQLSKKEEENSRFINILENMSLVKQMVNELKAAVVAKYRGRIYFWVTTGSFTRQLT
jgi:transcriptional regulator with XRE-family HTH domain